MLCFVSIRNRIRHRRRDTVFFQFVVNINDFGVAGATPWKVIGPIWCTDPVCTTEMLLENNLEYRRITGAVEYDGDRKDVSRRFHLSFAADTKTEFVKIDDCFKPYDAEAVTKYEESIFWQTEDSFSMDDLFGFKGPCVAYLARELVSPVDMEVSLQIGHASPFEVHINGEKVASRDACDNWYSENVHVQNVKIKKGINKIVIRLTRVNSDSKFNLIFSDGPSCTSHYVCFGSVHPEKFQ